MRRYFEKPDEALAPTVASTSPSASTSRPPTAATSSAPPARAPTSSSSPRPTCPGSSSPRIIDQYPNIARVVLHGIGEPMLVKDIAQRVAYLKARNIYVLFNTNGTSSPRPTAAPSSKPASTSSASPSTPPTPTVYQMVRGKDFFCQDRRERRATSPACSASSTPPSPRVSPVAHRPARDRRSAPRLRSPRPPGRCPRGLPPAPRLLRRAANERTRSPAPSPPSSSTPPPAKRPSSTKPRASPQQLGVMFSASGAVDPGESIRMQRTDNPWSLCRRPWSLMYITANGRVLPCCIAPFSMKGYGSLHPRRRHASHPARDLERPRVPALPRGPAHHPPHPRPAPTAASAGASNVTLDHRIRLFSLARESSCANEIATTT